MNKLLASVLCAALAITMQPISLAAAGKVFGQTNGQISGRATVDGKPLPNVTVRLRSVDTGQLVGNTIANAEGEFSFTGLGTGNFVVETVSAAGSTLGTSTTIALTAAAMIATNISVGTSAAALAATGGVGAAAGGHGLLGLSATALTVAGGATALGITGLMIAKKNDASPSR